MSPSIMLLFVLPVFKFNVFVILKISHDVPNLAQKRKGSGIRMWQ